MDCDNTVLIDERALQRAYKKVWRDNNKEKIKQYRLEYLKEHNNESVCPVCGGCYQKYGLSLHKTTKKHKTQLKIIEMADTIKTLEGKLDKATLPLNF